jgi:AcrR family transcriptional regulator
MSGAARRFSTSNHATWRARGALSVPSYPSRSASPGRPIERWVVRSFCDNGPVTTTPGQKKQTTTAAARGPGRGRRPKLRDEEVLDAAIKVFSRNGYDASTVQGVADELGILKGSLYHYIKTKEDLLAWIIEQVHRDVDDIVDGVQSTEGLDAAERIELFVRRQTLYNLTHLDLISIYHHDLDALTGARYKKIAARRRKHHDYLTGLVRDAQEQGLADASRHPHLLANCVFATIIWTYRWYRPNGGFSRDEVAETCAAFALNGIAARP